MRVHIDQLTKWPPRGASCCLPAPTWWSTERLYCLLGRLRSSCR